MNTEKIREALESGIIEPGLRKAALAELDKVQQPGKVLTDEVIDKYAKRYVHPYSTEVARAMRYARDNYGIGTHAAGLTVDEVMDVMNEWTGDKPDSFRSRLTAALEAKTRTA